MAAVRVIDDHEDLVNIGTHTHDEIDSHVDKTSFLVLSGVVSSALPPSARYVEAGPGIEIDDGGPGSSFRISSPGYVFPNDLSVSLTGGRSFGRYASGQTIPSTGKTPAEVILMAITEPIDPAVTLAGSNVLSSAFNTVGLVATPLTGTYVINSAGAAVSAASLSFRAGGQGAWSTLTTSTSNPLNYTHVFDAPAFFTQSLDYRYTVTDSLGASSTTYVSIVPQAYAPPTTSLTVAETSFGGISGETNLKRETGNVSSVLSGVIVRQRKNVPLVSYSVQTSTNGSTWTDVPGLSNVPIDASSSTVDIPNTRHNDLSLKSTSKLYYRVSVIDAYGTSTSSSVIINFYNVIWYGPVVSTPATSSDVRSISSKVFTDSINPLTLNTGVSDKTFVVALPSPMSVTEVIDVDSLNANITQSYVSSTMSVADAGGSLKAYGLYVMTNALPYSSNHRHTVTRA